MPLGEPCPLIMLALWSAGAIGCAAALTARRDLGGAMIGLPDRRAPRTRLLQSLLGFAVRRSLAPTSGWIVAIAAYFLLVGSLTSSILRFFDTSPDFADLAATAGFGGLTTANGFAAALFAILAIPLGLYAATRTASMVADEKARYWTSLHALPVSRPRVAATEMAVTAAGTVMLSVVAAVSMWAGASIAGAPLGLSATLAGAANVVPVALLSLGAAALSLGWWPEMVAVVGAAPVVGGFLLDVVADSVAAPQWLREISPFAHLAAVPDVPADWTAQGVLAAIGVAMALTGIYGYTRRDLRG